MSITDQEVAEIALGLTKAQRRMVLTDDSHFVNHAKGKWHGLNITTARRLFALGLIDEAITLAHPTPLGLRVRDYLTSMGEDR